MAELQRNSFGPMSLLRPRTIRGQLIAGLVLLEGLLFVLFAAFTVREHVTDTRQRTERRLEYQTTVLASEAAYGLSDHNLDRLVKTLHVMRSAPSVWAAQLTDLQGRTLASSDPSRIGKLELAPSELAQLPVHKNTNFKGAWGQREAVGPVFVNDRLSGYVWIYPNTTFDQRDLRSLLFLTLLYILAGVAGCTLLATLLARSITQPLKAILEATRNLVQHPEDTSAFPLGLKGSNEAADLATGLNLMVASIERQRAGLNDTLALLDSMLANAPIGLAFFDRKYRLVRINQFLAELNHMSINLHIGRSVGELLPEGIATAMQSGIETVFKTGEPVRDLDLSVEEGPASVLNETAGQRAWGPENRSWLTNLYPVKTGSQTVRWVGAIIVDTTERKRAEDALRKTEKLAAAGRLAASIAHEINNPLEAVTNLLYLLRHHTTLDPDAVSYAELAQREVARVSEITQQTLRFYRQSTVPLVSSVCEVLDSVVALHLGRVNHLQIEVVRKYGDDVSLFCFAGEMRQLFANLVGNALDAMSHGNGRLTLTVRRSRSWRGAPAPGVRVFVADTGIGMEEPVRQRIFEAFFTTKEVTGTGLGLWVSAEIIQKHMGTVRVRSRSARNESGPGGPSGTVFMVFFPETGAALATQKATAS